MQKIFTHSPLKKSRLGHSYLENVVEKMPNNNKERTRYKFSKEKSNQTLNRKPITGQD